MINVCISYLHIYLFLHDVLQNALVAAKSTVTLAVVSLSPLAFLYVLI